MCGNISINCSYLYIYILWPNTKIISIILFLKMFFAKYLLSAIYSLPNLKILKKKFKHKKSINCMAQETIIEYNF